MLFCLLLASRRGSRYDLPEARDAIAAGDDEFAVLRHGNRILCS